MNYGDIVMLKDEQLHSFSLDPSLSRHQGTTANEEPLLVNLVDTWRLRPEAVSRIPNLFLASDYVRTYTDLATMEAANEAARRAVNGILDAAGSTAARCGVWDLYEPEILAPWRELDLIRFTQGLPWDDTLLRLGLSFTELLEKSIQALEQGSEEGGVSNAYRADLPLPYQPVLSFLDRQAQPGVTSDLRREATALVERLVRLLAIRLVEAQGSRQRDLHVIRPRQQFRQSGDHPELEVWRDGARPVSRSALELSRDDPCRPVVGRAAAGAAALSLRAPDVLPIAHGQRHSTGAVYRYVPGVWRRRVRRARIRYRHRDAAQRLPGARRRRGRQRAAPRSSHAARRARCAHRHQCRRHADGAQRAHTPRKSARPGANADWGVYDEFEHMMQESLEGQAMELGWVRDNRCDITDEDYLRMVLKKTCWYSFIHPCRIGALIGTRDGVDLDRFNRFGSYLGTAFQIQDDLLNLTGDERRYGKEIGGDLLEGKRTLMLIHLLRQLDAREAARVATYLGQPRTARSMRDTRWILDLMRLRGSLDHARKVTRQLAGAALYEFTQAFRDVPESDEKSISEPGYLLYGE